MPGAIIVWCKGKSEWLALHLFARSLGHRFGVNAAPCGSSFRTRAPRPSGSGLLPSRRLRVPFQKLLLLATRRCRDLGAAHLRALWDVSRLTGQKGETPCRPNRPSPFSVPSATQPLAALPRPDASTPPSGSPSSANGTSRLSLQRRCLRQTGPLRQAAPSRYPHQASRTGAVSARQHREHPTPHRDLRATGKSGRTVAHTSPSDPSFPLFDNPSWLFRRDDFPQADFPLPDPRTNRLPTLSENRSTVRPLLRHVQHDRTNSTPSRIHAVRLLNVS